MKMDERKRMILNAIILDYIATADPVGSRTIARKYDLGVSSATVRNEMADLEEMGFIEQPHTSAGRVPSQSGYRYYVDCLMQKEPVANADRNLIRSELLNRIRETEILIQITGKLLSELTNYTALVLSPFFGKNSLKYIQLLPIENGKAVLVIVLDNGHVEHRVVDVPESIKEEEFASFTALLNEHLRGLALELWRPSLMKTIFSHLADRKKFLEYLMQQIEDSLSSDQVQKVFLGGTLNILNQPEFKQIDKVRSLLELLEEKDILKEVLSPDQENGVVVKIGSENRHEVMKDCSLITATYHMNGKLIGTLGLLGPTRMEYSKAVSIVEYLTNTLKEGINKL
ncbi:MAG: heat-inducible transcription repressor HrcA [Firmicutes bacterium HGW-Firmicutes-12]|jgi:heat-inducible transcriptional repressor|nr:MAG: heat-inducible transcription repressor HrcA [Firmicutes bacterium HGW-Firmicutes-12]